MAADIFIEYMVLRCFVWLLVFVWFCREVKAQEEVNGRVLSGDGQPLAGVNVRFWPAGPGTFTDSCGYFILKGVLPGMLCFSHLNYEYSMVQVSRKGFLQVVLQPVVHTLKEARVGGRPEGSQVYTSAQSLKTIPAILGEKDILKYIATMPGVVNRDVLDPGIYVRGGNSTENVYLVNGSEVSNPGHLTGILSVFDPWILERSVFYKSGFPVKYNKYLSSYLDMSPDAGDKEKRTGEVAVGLLSSALKVKGPLKRNVSAFGLSVRSSYLQYVSGMYNRKNAGSPMPSYSFYDITSVLDTRFSECLSLNLFGLFTADRLELEAGTAVPEQLKWRTFSGNFRFRYQMDRAMLEWKGGYRSVVTMADLQRNLFMGGNNRNGAWSSSLEYQQHIGDFVQWIGGMQFEYQRFSYGGLRAWNLKDEDYGLYSLYSALYVTWHENWKAEAGMNYQYYQGKTSADSWSPRLKLSWKREASNIWMDYAMTVQYQTLLPLLSVKSPVDVWCTLNKGMKPAVCHQYSAGINRSWKTGWNICLGIFRKQMFHLKDFDFVSLAEDTPLTERQTEGKGGAWGMEGEVIFQRNGWNIRVNYTFSDSWRQFRQINEGKKFYPPYDIRHNVLGVMAIPLQKRWTVQILWTYTSGMRTTFPVGVAVAGEIHHGQGTPGFVPVYRDRYNFKMPDHHRLDISLDYLKAARNWEWLCTIGVYNVYNRQNASFVYFKPEIQDKYYTRFVPYSRVLLPFVPYFSLILKW